MTVAPDPKPLPSYRLHRPTGLAVVTLDGRDHYLGRHNTPESVEAYSRTIAEWLANGRQLLPAHQDATVRDLTAAYLREAEGYYRKPDGTPTSETDNFRQAFRPLNALYGSITAREFGPKGLRAVQHEMIRLGWCRKNINTQVNRIRHFFKWAVSHELIPATVSEALRAVAPLKRGRCEARESIPVRPVPLEHVSAIKPYVSRQVWALVQLQLLTGARAGELVIMRPIDIDMTGETWIYIPTTHKTEHHGHRREIPIGPQARQTLQPFLANRVVDSFLFSPAESEAERRATVHAHRRTALSCGNRPGSNVSGSPKWKPGSRYDVASYRRAIARACRKAGIPSWHPHQLRHNFATAVRRHGGIEAARAALGHQTPAMTAIYAERDLEKVCSIVRLIG